MKKEMKRKKQRNGVRGISPGTGSVVTELCVERMCGMVYHMLQIES